VPVLEGFLEKKGSLVKSWRRRLMVLTSKRLRYHLQHSYEPQKGEILLSDVLDVTVDMGELGSGSTESRASTSGGMFRKSSSASSTVSVLTFVCTGRELQLRGSTSDIERWFTEIKAVLARLKAPPVAPVDPEVRMCWLGLARLPLCGLLLTALFILHALRCCCLVSRAGPIASIPACS
jgi:hypothetical protein